jgi:glycerol-3-phosphate dehydrogenase subunit B
MRFDTIIIGGGLAGYACGIRLAQAGQYCALVSAGQGALHFSSGSFDFLGCLPDGQEVERPAAVLPLLAEQAPRHPYSLLGAENCLALAREAETLLAASGVNMYGSIERNHLRLTPFGILAPSWLSAPEVPAANFSEVPPWKKVAIINIDGFLDFYPEILADKLRDMGIETSLGSARLSALNRLRENPSEFRSINIAQVLNNPDNFNQLADRLEPFVKNADALFLPACIGWRDPDAATRLGKRLGKPTRLIPTLPPSLIGSRINHILANRFRALGGVIMPGDTVVRGEIQGGKVGKIYTAHHTDIPLTADNYALTTGGFFSRGLTSDQTGIGEPVFGLDVTPTAANREEWTNKSVFAPQAYAKFGVTTDATMRGQIGGQPLANLYVAGMILAAADAARLGCGAGVALVSALAAAKGILGE